MIFLVRGGYFFTGAYCSQDSRQVRVVRIVHRTVDRSGLYVLYHYSCWHVKILTMHAERLTQSLTDYKLADGGRGWVWKVLPVVFQLLQVKVKVSLQLTVDRSIDRSVSLGAEPLMGHMTGILG